jgi:hypothetical protein
MKNKEIDSAGIIDDDDARRDKLEEILDMFKDDSEALEYSKL